jgi:hypothetical protein
MFAPFRDPVCQIFSRFCRYTATAALPTFSGKQDSAQRPSQLTSVYLSVASILRVAEISAINLPNLQTKSIIALSQTAIVPCTKVLGKIGSTF